MQGLELTRRTARAAARQPRPRSIARPRSISSWLGGAVRFDFGHSLLYSRPVSALVGERALNTAVLATIALLMATLIGIPLGIYSGTRTGPGRDRSSATISLVGLSVPPLIGSLALVFLAARTGWFPVGGMTSSGGIDMTWAAWLADLARHLPLPALALAHSDGRDARAPAVGSD